MDRFEAVETHADNHVGGWATASDNARLWVDVHGTGAPHLFVHGWTMSSRFWRRQLPLADDMQIIIVDLRGHGKSSGVVRGHTIPRYALDLRNVVRALNLRDVVLVGWSMGGSVVLDYWRQFGGERVSAVALVETGPAPMLDAPWNVHRYRGHDEAALAKDMERLETDRDGFGADFVSAMFLSGQAPAHALDWMTKEHRTVHATAARAVYEDYVRRDFTSILPTMDVPTLAVYGRSRHMCFGPSTGRYVAGSLPDSRFVIMENSGHLPFYEEAAAFNNALLQFAASR